MKEIVERLKENRQIELAKSILESNGYSVNKRLKESESDPLDGTIYDKKGTKYASRSVDRQTLLDYWNKGKELLASGKSADQIIEETIPEIKKSYEEWSEVRRELKSLRRKSDERSPEVESLWDEYRKLERRVLDLYKYNILPVLVATQQAKINQYGSATRVKPFNPDYFLTSILGDKNWGRFYY